MIDPLSLVSFGVGGLGELLKAMGVFKDPAEQAANDRREAMKSYLEKNVSDFQAPDQAFDPAKYSDVLKPMAQRNELQQKALGNSLGLQGLGRSGFQAERLAANQAQQNDQMNNTLTGLARTDQNDAYNKALRAYQMKMEKAKLLAGVQ
jgi:hypothetical protein